jgi:hypothetical protein
MKELQEKAVKEAARKKQEQFDKEMALFFAGAKT